VVTMDVPPQDVISRDNVSVKVNAVVFFRVVDPEKAIIQVEQFLMATSQLAQTTLRVVLGKHELDEMLSEREKLNLDVQKILDAQTDTWGIKAHTAGIEYSQPMWGRWLFSGSYRYYTQNGADFYSDLFPRASFQNFMVRDKEASALVSQMVGIGATYDFPVTWASWLKKGTVNLHYNHMMIDYSQFRDLTNFPPGSVVPGTEPLYSLDADIFQFFVSFWF